MNKYIIGFVAFFIFIGAGCDLNSQTQLDTDTTTEVDTSTQELNRASDEATVTENTTDSTAVIDVSADAQALIKLDEGLDASTDTMLKTKLDVIQDDAESMESKDETKTPEAEEKKTPGTYEDFDPSKLALASNGKVVLFFKANWCPSCVAFDKSVKANLNAIPAGTHILKIDYDNSMALQKRYGVTYQHTFVQVDDRGEIISKWSGSATLTDFIKRLK